VVFRAGVVRREVGGRLDWPVLGIASCLWRRGRMTGGKWPRGRESSLLLLEVGVNVWKAIVVRVVAQGQLVYDAGGELTRAMSAVRNKPIQCTAPAILELQIVRLSSVHSLTEKAKPHTHQQLFHDAWEPDRLCLHRVRLEILHIGCMISIQAAVIHRCTRPGP